ncbi:DUF3231 family protein [Metabacillus sp. FJAT-53654]|uniref:DUF3231 family protein n=1 Tax=Metabacillus rhizosphaerae TaxID=3117747 RepID=A0ABZ2MS62_9BACI
MIKHNIGLTSAEIGGLWEAFFQETMSVCLLKYFLHHIKDEEIKIVLTKALDFSHLNLKKIKEIYSKENIPLPDGFSEKDIDLSAPPLFNEPFALSYVYIMSRMGMINYAFITANIARSDILSFFTNALAQVTELYTDATTMMLSKGIYDRPPKISYPKKIEYIQKKSYISGFIGQKRTLNAVELTEIFFNIERNYFSILFCLGLIQVVKDKEIKNFIKDGKRISEKQINFFNEILQKEDFLGIISVSIEVTDSTISPFSDKLVMSLFHFLNSIDITLIGHALSMSMRADLSTFYSKVIGEILLYAESGFSIMVNRGWLEKPPQATNRKNLESR